MVMDTTTNLGLPAPAPVFVGVPPDSMTVAPRQVEGKVTVPSRADHGPVTPPRRDDTVTVPQDVIRVVRVPG